MPATLSWYIIDRLRGRDPVDWRQRFRKQREEFIANLQVDKDAREKARHKDTHPAHELAAYAGDYEHPAYGVMSIKEQGGALHWSWRGMFATMVHRHYETFELPEVPDRLSPDKLAITFLTIVMVALSVSRRRWSLWSQILCSYVLRLATAPLQLSANGASAVSRVARRHIV